MIHAHLHALGRVAPKEVLGGSLSALEDLHDPQAMEVVQVCDGGRDAVTGVPVRGPPPSPRPHSQAPSSSCFISWFSGMSWMAALIFSRMAWTRLCHFRLQCLLSTSQSAVRGSAGTAALGGAQPDGVTPRGSRGSHPQHRDKAPAPSQAPGRAGGERGGSTQHGTEDTSDRTPRRHPTL